MGIRRATLSNIKNRSLNILEKLADGTIPVGKASALTTPRDFQVKLNNEASQSFGGTSDVTSIGVSGTLSSDHGGTGINNANRGSDAALVTSPAADGDTFHTMPNGTSGQVLVSQGTGKVPKWVIHYSLLLREHVPYNIFTIVATLRIQGRGWRVDGAPGDH